MIFTGLTLVVGSLWGRPTWGTWWEWDARLTTTAILFFLYLGYLALRRTGATADERGKRCAIAALIAFADVPIVHFSVTWWQTLHQNGTVFNPKLDVKIHGSMAFTLVFGGRRVHAALRATSCCAGCSSPSSKKGSRNASSSSRSRSASARRTDGAGLMPHAWSYVGAGYGVDRRSRSRRYVTWMLRRTRRLRKTLAGDDRWLTRVASRGAPAVAPAALHDHRVALHRRGRVDAHADAEERRVLQDRVAKRSPTAARRHPHDAHRRRGRARLDPQHGRRRRLRAHRGRRDRAGRTTTAPSRRCSRTARRSSPTATGTARHVRVGPDPHQARLRLQADRRTARRSARRTRSARASEGAARLRACSRSGPRPRLLGVVTLGAGHPHCSGPRCCGSARRYVS